MKISFTHFLIFFKHRKYKSINETNGIHTTE